MHVLHIEHDAPDYDAWWQAFGNDPLDRRGSGVRGHRVTRTADDPPHVTVDLEFDGADDAQAFLAKLEDLWKRVDIMQNASGRIAEVVDTSRYH